jgi:hypothetical protein
VRKVICESFHLRQCQGSQFGRMNRVTTPDQKRERCPEAQEKRIIAHQFEPVARMQVWKIDAAIENYQSGSMADKAQPAQGESAPFPDKEALDRRRFACRIHPVRLTENPFRDLMRRNRRKRYGRILAHIVGTCSFHKQLNSLARPFTAGCGKRRLSDLVQRAQEQASARALWECRSNKPDHATYQSPGHKRAGQGYSVALFRRVKLWLWPCLSLVDRKATVNFTGRVQPSEKCHRESD